MVDKITKSFDALIVEQLHDDKDFTTAFYKEFKSSEKKLYFAVNFIEKMVQQPDYYADARYDEIKAILKKLNDD